MSPVAQSYLPEAPDPQNSSFFLPETSRNPFGAFLGNSSSSLEKKKEIKRGIEPGTSGVATPRAHHGTTASHTQQDREN